MKTIYPLIANLDLTQTREEVFLNRLYKVVPVVMAVEGVMNDLFYSAEELGKYTSTWNMRPVTLFHPKSSSGEYVSANDVPVASKHLLGILQNTRMEEDKLKSEAWIDVERVSTIRPEIMDYVNGSKEKLEVSTGLYGDILEKKGEYKGKSYDGWMVNIRPDHLALLPGGEGACNWECGCGIRANEPNLEHIEVVTAAMSELGIEDIKDFVELAKEQVRVNQQHERIDEVNKKEKVDALIACKRCKFEEKDREFLNGLNEEQLELITPPDNVVLKEETPAVVNEETPPNVVVEDLTPTINSAAEWLAAQENMPKDLKDQLAEGAVLRAQQRADLISKILANSKNTFTQEKLMAMETLDLKAIVTMAESDPVVNQEPSNPLMNYGMRLASNAMKNNAPQVKEDGLEIRSLQDVFKANRK